MLVKTAGLFADWPPKSEPPSAQPVEESRRPAKLRFKVIDRRQSFFRAVDVDGLIDDDHAARAIWSVLQELDLSEFSQEARAVEGVAGRALTDPCLLASLWIYSYSQGIGE